MKIEIISIGTEVITGETINTNSSYLANKLFENGFEVNFITSVGDDPLMIKEALKVAYKRSDLIITTGGLGPTEDDRTKEILCEFLDLEMIFDKDMKIKLEERLSKYNVIPENNYKQAMKINGSYFLHNEIGTAPGLFLDYNNVKIVLLPGPPKEMRTMFKLEVLPMLNNNGNEIVSKIINVIGIGESLLETKIKDLLHLYKNISVATFARPDRIDIRFIGRGTNVDELNEEISDLINKISKRIGDNIYSYNNEGIEEVVFKLLNKNDLKIGFCESCTGGLVSGNFSRIAGVSSVFDRSFITYSNLAKTEELFVSEQTLNIYGAVSENTAIEMAKGALKRSSLDIVVSITGIAGPESDYTNKPVGLIYMCIMDRNNSRTYKLNLSGNRHSIQDHVVKSVFFNLRKFILEYID